MNGTRAPHTTQFIYSHALPDTETGRAGPSPVTLYGSKKDENTTAFIIALYHRCISFLVLLCR